MSRICILSLMGALFLGCQPQNEVPRAWVFHKTIDLDGVNPIGAVQVDGSLWLSDGDHNRLVRISELGKIVSIVDSLERPMHMDASEDTLYVPLYGQDTIFIFSPNDTNDLNESYGQNGKKDTGNNENPVDTINPSNLTGRHPEWTLPNDSLDAPAGVSVFHQEKAIADFYNNRILYHNGTDWISFGKEGKAEGEFYYPTDVQITEDHIWVADAYNHRVQVFDKKGNYMQMIGQDQKMSAATGIFVSEKELFVTDFENNRVLVFDRDGNLKQEIKENIEKPTDILLWNNMLYVLNYRKGSISIFQWAEPFESTSIPNSGVGFDSRSAFKPESDIQSVLRLACESEFIGVVNYHLNIDTAATL